jgi:hypothetical protein
MSRWLIVAAMLAASPVMAADARRAPVPNYDLWSPQQGESDSFHGIWVVNATSGRVYRCYQVVGNPTCIEATMMTAEQWANFVRQNQQQQQK